jgi:SAM-dependent methyltransferase
MALGAQLSITPQILDVARGARGIEIGGPSRCFRRRGIVPIYPVVSELDIVNFSSTTLWEGSLVEGAAFAPEGTTLGVQWLREATDLRGISDQSYDIVASSHCLEHSANALLALKEWKRICKDDGFLCLVVPHRQGTFDWKRPVTTMEHYRQDEAHGVPESDETHFEEIICLHDIRRDSGVSSRQELRTRVGDNNNTRAVHHHVLDTRSAVNLVAEAGWSPLAAEARRPYDIVVFAQNRQTTQITVDLSAVTRVSPFSSDRQDP